MAIDAQQPPDDHGAEGPRLDGWKEIASYLNRHVTTVRRWEKTEGLPVHRHLHDKLGSVYAFPGELDAWWRSRRARLEASSRAEISPRHGVDTDAIDSQTPPAPVARPGELAVVLAGDNCLPEESKGFCDSPHETTVVRGSEMADLPRRWRMLAGVMVVAAAVAMAGYALSRSGDEPRPEIRSLAVLPLENLLSDPAQKYFADGMTDAVIANLTQIEALRVISRTSVMRFKGSDKPLPAIARELGVDAVVEGSVQRFGTRVKVTMQLIHGASDTTIWAREYEREQSDVLKLQADVSRAVTNEIRIRLTAEERARLASARRIDPAAHEAYLLGRYHAWKLTEDDLRLAIDHFERAIEIEPRYAAAHAELSLAWQYRSVFAATPFSESEAPARSAARMALALDEGVAAVHLATGHFCARRQRPGISLADECHQRS